MLFSLTISPEGAYLFQPVGGEGLTPLWSADFVNGVYAVDGVTAALGDMFAENSDWASWNPASVVGGVGLVGLDDQGPTLIGAARAALLGGATYVAEVKEVFLGGDITVSFNQTGSSIPARNVTVGQDSTRVQARNPPAVLVQDFGDPIAADTVVKIAFTLAPTHVALSVSGGAVIIADLPDPNTLNLIGLLVNTGATVETLTAYSTQLDADLPSLSAA